VGEFASFREHLPAQPLDATRANRLLGQHFSQGTLVLWAGIEAAAHRVAVFARTYNKRMTLLDSKLTILFLNGTLPNAVPLLFGELFTTVLYRGLAVDPGHQRCDDRSRASFGRQNRKSRKS